MNEYMRFMFELTLCMVLTIAVVFFAAIIGAALIDVFNWVSERWKLRR